MELIKLKSYINPEENIRYYESEEEVLIPRNYLQKKVELRAVWVATVGNINFSRTIDEKSFKAEFVSILDKMEEFNLNCLFFQIRPMNDCFYRSRLNPYSRYLAGGEGVYQEGKDPGFDPLAFMIEESHKRNIQFHGWLNPYRASGALNKKAKTLHKLQLDKLKTDEIKKMHPTNFVAKNSDMVVISNEGMLILNPARKEVRRHILDSIMEICANYPEIDGIHFDDYFYPSEGLHPEYDDTKDYRLSKIDQNLSDFRRDNVTQLVKVIKKEIEQFNKKNNKKIAFGISPFGIYKNGKENNGSNTMGSEAYVTWYADLQKWIDNKYIDYIMPQLYWEFEHAVARYADLVDWWSNAVLNKGVKLFIGLSIGRCGETPGYNSENIISDMIKYLNKFSNIEGVCLWSYKDLFPKNEIKEKSLENIKKLWTLKAEMPLVKELKE